ncbi:hypothetical protein [Streptomyces sp. NPDC046939]|uniref:hypothetical protein n=1 Tax=Streptomyces sp. NPDC046939 TaxID=3155376 RepID=UPI0033CFA7E6
MTGTRTLPRPLVVLLARSGVRAVAADVGAPVLLSAVRLALACSRAPASGEVRR